MRRRPLRATNTATTARFEQIYARHYQAVLAYCVRRLGRVDAYDAAAEVFAVAWRRLEVVPSGDDTLRWLYGVAFRVVSRQRRGGTRYRRLIAMVRSRQPAPPVGPEAQVVRKAEYELVLTAAARLPAIDQEILRLAMWEELSHGAIAELLGIRVEAVRQRLSRAKRRLGREYRKLGGVVPDGSVGQGEAGS